MGEEAKLEAGLLRDDVGRRVPLAESRPAEIRGVRDIVRIMRGVGIYALCDLSADVRD